MVQIHRLARVRRFTEVVMEGVFIEEKNAGCDAGGKRPVEGGGGGGGGAISSADR